MHSSPALLRATLLAALVAAPVARAAVEAVDEEETHAPAAPNLAPSPHAAPAVRPPQRENTLPAKTRPRRRAARTSPAPIAPSAASPESRPNPQAPSAPDEAPAAPAPEAAPPAPPPLRIPHAGFPDLLAAFRARQQAVTGRNPGDVAILSRDLADLRETLDFPDLFSTAEALCHEATRELLGGRDERALAAAKLAARLAPDLPDAYWLAARVQLLSHGFSGAGEAARAIEAGLAAEVRDPRSRRLLLGNLTVAAIFAGVAASVFALLLLSLLSLRRLFHDFHHLFPKAVNPAQTTLFGALLLAGPWLFHLGPFALLATLAAVAWPYQPRGGHAAILLALGMLVAAPRVLALAGPAALSPLGTDLYLVERDLDSGPEEATLENAARAGNAPFAVLFALARRAKRLGDLPAAKGLYEQALAAEGARAEAENDLGNVLFLQGDLAGAKKLYDQAVGDDPNLAAAYFNLGRYYNHVLQLDQSQDAQRRALALDPALIEPHLGGDDRRANRFLIDVPLPWRDIVAAGVAPQEAGIRRQVEARLDGPLGGSMTEALIILAGVIVVLTFLAGKLHLSSTCVQCGRPACGRCDEALAGEGLCGQCVAVFVRRAGVDPVARLRKEIQVRVHKRRRHAAVRALAILTGGGGHVASGRPFAGLVLLWIVAFLAAEASGVSDVLRAPTPGMGAFRAAAAAVALALVYLFAVGHAFLESR